MNRVALLTSVGLGALIASSGLAHAQDMFDWSGFYVGGSIGAGGISTNMEQTSFDYDYTYTEGALAALATAGVNMQDGSLVYGIEGDIGLMWEGDSEPSADDSYLDGYDLSTSMSPMATLRGRIGFASGNALFYGTAGLAIANFDIYNDYDFHLPDASRVEIGGVVGIGAEYAVTDKLSLKGEVRYSAFDVEGEADDSYVNHVNSTIGLVGLNYHF
jgi:outer membrane immunogenic protein